MKLPVHLPCYQKVKYKSFRDVVGDIRKQCVMLMLSSSILTPTTRHRLLGYGSSEIF